MKTPALMLLVMRVNPLTGLTVFCQTVLSQLSRSPWCSHHLMRTMLMTPALGSKGLHTASVTAHPSCQQLPCHLRSQLLQLLGMTQQQQKQSLISLLSQFHRQLHGSRYSKSHNRLLLKCCKSQRLPHRVPLKQALLANWHQLLWMQALMRLQSQQGKGGIQIARRAA